MKKAFVYNILILSIILLQNSGMPSFAQENSKEYGNVYTYYVKKEQSEEAKELNVFLSSYLSALNSHNIKAIDDYYAFNYISGDGFNKNQILNLIKETWDKYPNLKYLTSIKNLRFENNRASIEFDEKISAETKDKSEITQDKGSLQGMSHNILYLQKFGSGWKIITDKTLYEEATVKYGNAKNIKIGLQVPEQVLAGEDYSSSLITDLTPSVFALGSITSMPLSYPAKKQEETFRQIPFELNTLERVMKSNKDCVSEIVSAAVSFCEAQRKSYTSVDLKVLGTAVIFKRVNVIKAR